VARRVARVEGYELLRHTQSPSLPHLLAIVSVLGRRIEVSILLVHWKDLVQYREIAVQEQKQIQVSSMVSVLGRRIEVSVLLVLWKDLVQYREIAVQEQKQIQVSSMIGSMDASLDKFVEKSLEPPDNSWLVSMRDTGSSGGVTAGFRSNGHHSRMTHASINQDYRERRADNPSAAAESFETWRADNPSAAAESFETWRADNPSAAAESFETWRASSHQ
jgi:hypothetical protein